MALLGLCLETFFSRLARPLQHQRTLFNGEMQTVNRPRKEGPSKNVMLLSHGRKEGPSKNVMLLSQGRM